MFLKNYTSDVPVSQTIYRIEQVLIKCGVQGITKEYRTDGTVSALTFHIKLPDAPTWTIRMPVDPDAATQALWMEYVGLDKLSADGQSVQWSSRKKKKRSDFKEQGERTAWKIMQDWVEVQMSMVQMKQADFRQVFLPYVWDGKRSFYDRLQSQNFKAMLPEHCETQ